MSLYTEINEQVKCLRNLLINQRDEFERIARVVIKTNPQFVFLAARGSSDNAGRYANYLFGAKNNLPVALATPSLFTYYESPPRLNNALVMGISQSGKSPDIVSVLKEAQKQACLTISITNVPDSPLAQTAEYSININVGPERSIAATKTYTAELMSLAMLSSAMNGSQENWEQLERIPEWVEQVLQLDNNIASGVNRFGNMQQCVVLGRGYNYSTAFEWALKLKELSYIGAEPYSSADFKHGPIAIIEKGFPILAVVPQGKVRGSMMETLRFVKQELSARLIVISNDPEALDLAELPLPIPEGIPEWLSPIPSIVIGQLFTYYLTLSKGNNPEKPRTIQKITETKQEISNGIFL